MLALYEKRDPDRALELLAGHFESADRWTRAGARLMHAFLSMNLGRVHDVARECAEALAGFQAIGDQWGMALALVGQAELVTFDGDYAGAIAALEQAVGLSRALTDWEDTAQMYASLAKCRSRLGDYESALADLARAERAAREQGESESDLWITYVRAELAWLQGDTAEAGRIARQLDARMASKKSVMISPFRAQAKTRAALADIRSGNVAAGWAELVTALHLARDGQERWPSPSWLTASRPPRCGPTPTAPARSGQRPCWAPATRSVVLSTTAAWMPRPPGTPHAGRLAMRLSRPRTSAAGTLATKTRSRSRKTGPSLPRVPRTGEREGWERVSAGAGERGERVSG